jgi:hypothetical protein
MEPLFVCLVWTFADHRNMQLDKVLALLEMVTTLTPIPWYERFFTLSFFTGAAHKRFSQEAFELLCSSALGTSPHSY